jgi:hypothetical protein
MTDIRIPADHKMKPANIGEALAGVDVAFMPTNDNVQMYANERGRAVVNKKFATGQFPWIFDARLKLPPGWQVTMLDDNPTGVTVLMRWCLNNGCTIMMSAGGTDMIFGPEFDGPLPGETKIDAPQDQSR